MKPIGRVSENFDWECLEVPVQPSNELATHAFAPIHNAVSVCFSGTIATSVGLFRKTNVHNCGGNCHTCSLVERVALCMWAIFGIQLAPLSSFDSPTSTLASLPSQ